MNSYSITLVPVGELHFDIKNPRLAEFSFSTDVPEREVFSTLWDVMGVKEIVLSIVASGFFAHEPLIITEEDNKLIVIEGNRRLAAVKAILDEAAWSRLGITNVVSGLTPENLDSLRTLPCIKVDSREDAWRYIGFKHINGPVKWGSYAKAQYIASIKRDFNVPLRDIAEQIGDTHKTVQKLYQGLMVIDQAEKEHVFNRANINAPRLYFSHLYTGLGYEGIQNFLGIRGADEETTNPVPVGKTRELGELMSWMFGDKITGDRPVITSQNPDLRQLDSALRHTASTVWLRSKRDLKGAFEKSRSDKDKFQENLVNAQESMQNALRFQPTGFDGDASDIETAEAILKSAITLREAMKNNNP